MTFAGVITRIGIAVALAGGSLVAFVLSRTVGLWAAYLAEGRRARGRDPILSGELWLRVDAGAYSLHRSVKQRSGAHDLPCDSRRGKYHHGCD